MKHIRVIWDTLILQMKNSFIRPMYRFCLIANPIVTTILLYEMYQNSEESNFVVYVILGAGLMGVWSCICFSSAGDINRERYSGTLAIIFTTPASFREILLAKVIGNTLLSFISVGISFLTARLLFHIDLKVTHPGYLLLSFAVAILCFITISICIVYLLTLSRRTELYMNCIEIPVILLCGFAFPVEVLPFWVRQISYCLSPTWAIKLLRMSFNEQVAVNEYLGVLKIAIVFIIFDIILGRVLYSVVEDQVRIKATLEVS